MMAPPCSRRSPLPRSGLAQQGRRRAELGADYFRLDERDLADLILFGRRYARHIRYYDSANRAQGDWSDFFENDVTATLAALSKLPVDEFAAFQRDLETWLKADPQRDPQWLAAHFKLVFHLPLTLVQSAGELAAKLPPDHPLTHQAAELARRELADPIAGLIAWYKGATDAGGPEIFPDDGIDPADYKLAAGADARLRLSSTFKAALMGRGRLADAPIAPMLLRSIPPGEWAGIWAAVAADGSPYRDASGPHLRYEQVYDALEYNLFDAAIRNLYRAMARLRHDAEVHLRESLESFAGHLPHYGLWLTFLRLFEHARGALNGFTGRHLDFYFRDVLGLGPRAAEPDRVHLLFELAKGTEARRLGAGTAFKAGKDRLGRPVTYALEHDVVLNRGRVVELRGLRVDAAAGGELPRASIEVRSRDGLGEQPPLPDSPSWAPFGPGAAPAARIGFAVADRRLFLREGSRLIHLCVTPVSALKWKPPSDCWRVRLTGADGWWEPEGGLTVVARDGADAKGERPASLKGDDRGPGSARGLRFAPDDGPAKGEAAPSRLSFLLVLPPEAPPIIPFDPELHGDGEGEAGPPRMEILFDFEQATAARAFKALRGLRIRDVTLEVAAIGLKQLSLVAAGAPADPSKPFAPFGALPRGGSSLIVGSSEIFSKPIADLSLTLDWEQSYDSGSFFLNHAPSSYRATEAILRNGRWQQPQGDGREAQARASAKRVSGHQPFAAGQSVTIGLDGAELIDGRGDQSLDDPALGPRSVSGFVRLTLSKGFGHDRYPMENARALVALAKDGTDYQAPNDVNVLQDLPRKPYDPVVTRIEAAYRTREGRAESFLHLHPFGDSPAPAGSGTLLPALPFSGALMVGVADFAPPARLSLLVQVADGSGDPLRKPPKLRFDYLVGDRWLGFEARDVDDKTGNFATSGLIGLAVPEDADRRHRLMPDGLHWFRISADKDADALNRLLSVDAQAARAAFVDAGNDPQFLATPLPAGTISKLVVPDLAVKKVVQPYASSGGRPVEAPEAFSTRVSERLRHKDRAVSMFDYEALVLEAFPQLYRARCIPTAALVRDAANRIAADNEVAPGAVTLVTVPWTHGRNMRDPLRPYADQALLAAVDDFLRRRVSPFVRLEVQNPKFEEVQAEFKVRFHPEIADIAFYLDALNAAVVEYLTPWARPGGGEIVFGGRLWKSSLIDFVEERPEVDFVTDFKLYHKPDADAPTGAWTPVDVELVEATTARSILVSAPLHTILEASRRA